MTVEDTQPGAGSCILQAVIRAVSAMRPLHAIDRETSLATDLRFDEIDRLSLACDLDEQLLVQSPDGVIGTVETVGEVADVFARLVQERGA